MSRHQLADLQAFVKVAQARSFTRAAAQLDISRSALSHAMTGLEQRLGVRLLTRTTRSVSLTDAGARLLGVLQPRFEDIDAELAQLSQLRDKPAGTVRITAHDHAIRSAMWAKLLPLMQQYPDVHVEISIDYAFTDIAAQRFDAGVRAGNSIDKDMIAVRIGPDFRMGVGASPAYLVGRALPRLPKDLMQHRCVNLRLPRSGTIYAWPFTKGRRSVEVRVDGGVVLNNSLWMLQAALDGMGLCYVPEDLMQPYFDAGTLVPLLADWWPRMPGYHLYYPSRRQQSPAFALVVEALRHR